MAPRWLTRLPAVRSPTPPAARFLEPPPVEILFLGTAAISPYRALLKTTDYVEIIAQFLNRAVLRKGSVPMRARLRTFVAAFALSTPIALAALLSPASAADQTILNVSYDPTRELYKA